MPHREPMDQEYQDYIRRHNISFRFYLFVIGLIFAVVSYAGLNIKSGGPGVSISLLLLSLSGLFLLLQKAMTFSM